jgi:hypothetical protein
MAVSPYVRDARLPRRFERIRRLRGRSRRGGREPSESVDHPLTSPEALVRPWRTATFVASAVAAVELVVLCIAGVALLAKPIAHRVQTHEEKRVFAGPTPKKVAPIPPKPKEHAPRLSRARTSVLILNGNGRTGAASTAATLLHDRGYRLGATGNAKRADYATSVVMYRPGARAEGLRLARDFGVRVVGPLDGMRTSDLHGATAVLILGAQ